MIQQAQNITKHAKSTAAIILIIFVIAMVGFSIVGRVYSETQSRVLLEAIAPSLRTLCFAVITTSATIIPLLMTMLSLARKTDDDFDKIFYIRLRIITWLGTVALISATLLLLVISIPITEAERLRQWYGIMYIAVVMGASSIAALLVGIIVTLYKAMQGMLTYLTPSFSSEDAA